MKRTLLCLRSPRWQVSPGHTHSSKETNATFAALRLFLRVNGYDTAFDDAISWAEEIIALVEHRSSEEDFVRAVRPFAVVDA